MTQKWISAWVRNIGLSIRIREGGGGGGRGGVGGAAFLLGSPLVAAPGQLGPGGLRGLPKREATSSSAALTELASFARCYTGSALGVGQLNAYFQKTTDTLQLP